MNNLPPILEPVSQPPSRINSQLNDNYSKNSSKNSDLIGQQQSKELIVNKHKPSANLQVHASEYAPPRGDSSAMKDDVSCSSSREVANPNLFPYLSHDITEDSNSSMDSSSSFPGSSTPSSSSFSFPSINMNWWKGMSSKTTKPVSRVKVTSISQDAVRHKKVLNDTTTRSKSADYRGSKPLKSGPFDIKVKKTQCPTPTPLFRVVDALGMGHFSILLKVEDVKAHKLYAMKKISKSKYPTSQNKKQLEFELETATQGMSPCPFILSVLSIYEDVKFVYAVSELMCGDLLFHLSTRLFAAGYNSRRVNTTETLLSSPPPSLSSSSLTVQGGPFTEDECRVLLAELSLAIQHVHKHDIVHRDIKMENVMVDFTGHVKLGDFGHAIKIDEEGGVPVVHSGNVSIMAPELLTNNKGGKHGDWWAFGVISYELLTGCSPWSSLQDASIITNDILKKPLSVPSFLSNEAKEFLLSLLERDYKQRLGTAVVDEAISNSSSVTIRHSEKQLLYTRNRSIARCSFFDTIKWNEVAFKQNKSAFQPSPCYISDHDRNLIREEMAKHGSVQGQPELPPTIQEEPDDETSASKEKLYGDIATVMIGSY